MIWFLGLVCVAVAAAGVLAASGRLGDMPDLPDDRPVPRLPAGDFDADSLAAVRFATVPRGYAPAQVDQLLRRVRAALSGADEPAVNAEDVRSAIFDVVSFGYQMHQVDVVLERLARQLDRLPAADAGDPEDVPFFLARDADKGEPAPVTAVSSPRTGADEPE